MPAEGCTGRTGVTSAVEMAYAPAGKEQEGRIMRILCVDDEPLALKMLEMSIQKAVPDADVTAFEDQDELLEEAKKKGCDIAFLDIHMRGMNGVELAKKLKEVNPKMNLIFVTGYSEYTGDAMSLHASGYIMKPVSKSKVEKELADLRFPIQPKKNALLRVQCFGNFDVFTPDGAHVRFERSKSKEMFAYLVHKRGTSCTSREIFAAIFEDEPYDKKLQNLLQTYTHAMMKSLKAVGAESAVIHTYNAFAVNPEVIDCDAYRFSELDPGAVNAYECEYMSQYYWADFSPY